MSNLVMRNLNMKSQVPQMEMIQEGNKLQARKMNKFRLIQKIQKESTQATCSKEKIKLSLIQKLKNLKVC